MFLPCCAANSDLENRTAGRLYSDSTHFLLELIQNADDNKYGAVIPTIKFTYRDGFLRIDGNEIDFSAANVESICSAGESTKAEAKTIYDRDVDRIGEKGLGFKSVFDVAQYVWIHSGFYSFQFVNKESEILGMIAPKWAELPNGELPRPGYTTILLGLAPGSDPRKLIGALKSIDPSLLLFLNRLRRVDVDLNEVGRPRWTVCLERLDDSPKENDLSISRVRRGDEITSYYAFHRTLTERNLASDKRRLGCKTSHMQLVFPINSDTANKEPPTQPVFAFLPVRDYGLKVRFIPHVD